MLNGEGSVSGINDIEDASLKRGELAQVSLFRSNEVTGFGLKPTMGVIGFEFDVAFDGNGHDCGCDIAAIDFVIDEDSGEGGADPRWWIEPDSRGAEFWIAAEEEPDWE